DSAADGPADRSAFFRSNQNGSRRAPGANRGNPAGIVLNRAYSTVQPRLARRPLRRFVRSVYVRRLVLNHGMRVLLVLVAHNSPYLNSTVEGVTGETSITEVAEIGGAAVADVGDPDVE